MSPYQIEGPALISFSGGRTSGFMLHEIIDTMEVQPHDVYVVFANTGKELPETLDFVKKCETWGWDITWIEWTLEKPKFQVVNYETADRTGKPLADLIGQKQQNPKALRRFCTEHAKVITMKRFMKSKGHKHWTSVVGLRYDEGYRLLKMYARNDDEKQPWTNYAPLSKDKIVKDDVMEFWSKQPFDLGLEPFESNCDLCFLKSRNLRRELIRRRPWIADWWIEQEERFGYAMTDTYFVKDLVQEIDEQPMMDFLDEEHEVECGLICSGEEFES